MAARTGSNSQSSLPSLPAHLQSDTHLTAHLASRFHLGQCTASLSSSALISLNNYKSSSVGPDGTKAGSAMAGAEDMAERIWARLGERAENQAVVFLGESGSGKTTLRSHLLSAILAFSSTPLSTKLSLAAFVFDSLTTTKTATSPTASKAGLFYELQYDTTANARPTLIGGKLLDHRLERSRVATVPTGERNYHVLYYLLAGTSPAEKAHLGLDATGPTVAAAAGDRSSAQPGQRRWRYLGHPTQLKVGIDDADGFQHFKTALRKLEFPRSEIAEICQILASILHLGQLEFTTSQYTTPTGDDSGGFSHEGGETVTVVRNRDSLAIVAAFLGVGPAELETRLGYRTKTLHRERVTVMLDPRGARENADELARTLYALLLAYLVESINQRLCAADASVANTVSVVDFPGFAQAAATGSSLDQLLNNAATESLAHFCLQSFFDLRADRLDSEDVAVPATSYFDNSDAVRGLLKPGNGLLAILDDQARRRRSDLQFLESLRKRFDGKNPAITAGQATATLPGSNFATANRAASFTVKHFAGEIEYPVGGLVEENGEAVSGDLMNLLHGTRSDFVRELFGQPALKTVSHPKEKSTIVEAQVSSRPLRMPSVARRKAAKPGPARDDDAGPFDGGGSVAGPASSGTASPKGRRAGGDGAGSDHGAAGQFLAALETIDKALTAPNTNASFVICLKPNDRRIANQFDSKCVRTQVQSFGIAEISQRLRNADFSLFLPFGEFLGLAEAEAEAMMVVGSEREKAELLLDEKRWPANEARVGSTGVFLSERCWAELARPGQRGLGPDRSLGAAASDEDGAGDGLGSPGDGIARPFADSKVRLIASQASSPGGGLGLGDEAKHGSGYFGGRDDARSEAGASAFQAGDMFRNLETRAQMAEKGNERKMEEVDDIVTSASRTRWLFVVWLLTFWLPDFLIRWVGRMKRRDVRMAWREKLAINLLIWLSCGFVVFIIIIFPNLICPHQYVFSSAELAGYDGKGGNGAYTAIRGEVFDLNAFIPAHYPSIVPGSSLRKYAGVDATGLFPVQVSSLCAGKDGQVDAAVALDYTPTNQSSATAQLGGLDPNARYHDFRYLHKNEPDGYRRDWYWEQMIQLRANFKKGTVGFTPDYLQTLAGKQQTVGSINGKVYDLTAYQKGGRNLLVPPGESAPSGVDTDFMDPVVVELFQTRPGQDLTKYWQALQIDAAMRQRMQACLDHLFYVGDVDTRNSTRCQFARYILLAISILLASVIGFKFFAALQFGRKNVPENLDKFIICQVPAYTEDEDSLRRAIDSAARMRYDDKRKLLVIVCDGMIIGQGNDRPTPRIVLDILGVADTVDPEPLSFESLGEGMKQHNMGKVYSGLYEVQGHIVPFLVVVKVGKPSEVSRPGNRGKRDSQMILMRFLNRVHYNAAMSPMELEMHHQIRNIIGVNPTFYEFMLQIDADTVVAADAGTRMVAAFLHDTRLIGLCGETALTNAKASFTTMIQVYEYYISHNLSKAFESLFGSVTCLPGCFSMYRIRAADTGKPLFVSREVVEAYATVRVDTLHMKNLLYLGEDRYLTTLLLKHHPKYKTKFIFSARAWTIAPDSWKVFLSQRRRWINSTVHNLMELMPLTQLCGFCCFSMRFVVFLDLLSTIVQPVTVAYIVYLIVLVAQSSDIVPVTAFILLGAIYGLQAVIFILRRKWEMIGWMVIYVLAIPVFSFALPLYAFWHMDDFSWGNTRVVTGEKGRKIVISDEGRFEPGSIPRKKWEEYQAELWEAQTARDDRSEASAVSYATKSYPAAASEWGGYAASRPGSQLQLPALGGSRLSLAPSELLGTQRASTVFAAGHEVELTELAGLPSDDAILAEIRDMLKTADMMSVTKKSIKAEVERRFELAPGALDGKKAYINSATEALLSGQL